MEIEGKLTTHCQSIVEKFNTYYISAADNITNNNQANNTIHSLLFISEYPITGTTIRI